MHYRLIAIFTPNFHCPEFVNRELFSIFTNSYLFSLDELPQLINVFKRDMNLIGPRPLPDYEVEEMDDKFSIERHRVRPGITGLWQVSERENISSFENWIKLDLYYINNWSLILDAKIILKTISIILFGRGH